MNKTHCFRPVIFLASLLGVASLLTMSLYRIQELLVCWLCFTLAFALLTLAALAFTLIIFFCKRAFHWGGAFAQTAQKSPPGSAVPPLTTISNA